MRLSRLAIVTALALLTGTAHAAIVLDVGSATGDRGTAVLIPVTMSGATSAVAGIQIDINFSSADFIVVNPSAACVAGTALPGGMDVFTSVPAPGKLRVLVLDFDGGTFGNGELVRCTFGITAAATITTHTLTPSRVGASGPGGSVLSASGDPGSITATCPVGCC